MNAMRTGGSRRQRLGEDGFGLVETTVAILIVATIALVAAGALGVAVKASGTARMDVTAQALARSELEYVKSLPAGATSTYALDPNLTIPQGYTAALSASVVSNNAVGTCLQLITITVTRPGHPDYVLEEYKPQSEKSQC